MITSRSQESSLSQQVPEALTQQDHQLNALLNDYRLFSKPKTTESLFNILLNPDESLSSENLNRLLRIVKGNSNNPELISTFGKMLQVREFTQEQRIEILSVFLNLNISNIGRESWIKPWVEFTSQSIDHSGLQLTLNELCRRALDGHLSGYEHILEALKLSGHQYSNIVLNFVADPQNNYVPWEIRERQAEIDRLLNPSLMDSSFIKSMLQGGAFLAIGSYFLEGLNAYNSSIIYSLFLVANVMNSYFRFKYLTDPLVEDQLLVAKWKLQEEVSTPAYRTLNEKAQQCLLVKPVLDPAIKTFESNIRA